MTEEKAVEVSSNKMSSRPDMDAQMDVEKALVIVPTGSEQGIMPVTHVNTSDDEQLVDWDGDHDPGDPRNWSTHLKTINFSLLSAMTFVT